MTVPPTDVRLAADFAVATAGQWRRLALGVLKKSGLAGDEAGPEVVDEVLATTSYDGIRSLPLYSGPAEDVAGLPGLFPFVRGARAAGSVRSGWDVRQRHADPDPKAANGAVRADLDNGATSVWLAFGDGALTATSLAEVLDGVYLDLAGVVLDAPDDPVGVVTAWFELVDASGTALDVSGSLRLDPLGWRARRGAAGVLSVADAAGWAVRCATAYPRLRSVTVDGTIYHDAGASDAEELGCA